MNKVSEFLYNTNDWISGQFTKVTAIDVFDIFAIVFLLASAFGLGLYLALVLCLFVLLRIYCLTFPRITPPKGPVA